MPKLIPPVSYQGSKVRIASKILDHIQPNPEKKFYDLCCGNGAITLELLNRGFDPKNITMVDNGPWGLFWKEVGDGSFDVDKLICLCNNIPEDKSLIKEHVECLASKVIQKCDVPYIYLILQAAAFGGKALWLKEIEENLFLWQNTSFRNYWHPTEESSRRYSVNPMMPMPNTILQRTKNICNATRGITCFWKDVRLIHPEPNTTVYLDPPYQDTGRYGTEFDVRSYAKTINHTECWISECKSLSKNSVLISGGRSKGGILGKRKKLTEEWLSRM